MYWYYKLIAIIVIILLFIFGSVTLFSGDDTNERGDIIQKKSQNVQNNKVDNKENVQDDKVDKVDNKENVVQIVDKKQFDSLLEEVKVAKQLGNLDSSLEKLYLALSLTKKFTFSWFEVGKKIGKIHSEIINTSVLSKHKITEEVSAYNLLERIARTHKTTYQQIMKLNHIKNARTIHKGEKIWVFPGPWKIKIYKSQFKLLLYNREKLFKVYDVGIGDRNNTPEGKFIIWGKIANPIWERVGKKPIPAGDSRNELGTRWMRIIEPTNTFKGFGIHGTIAPNTIGKAVSQGCIRLVNSDVEEIYNFIPEKTQVEIYP